MNILRIIVTMNPSYGGPCQGIRNSIPALRRIGITNEVLCFDDPSLDYGLSDGFIIHKIGKGKGPYFYNENLHRWLLDNFYRFDVVIVHGLWLYTSYGTYRVWSYYKTLNHKFPKLYVMPHGMLDPYFQNAKDRKLKAFRNFIFWHLLEKKVVNGVDGLLFTCQMELELAHRSFSGYEPKKELNVGYGILAPPVFEPKMGSSFLSKAGIKSGEPYLLFLSRIHSKKGLNILVKAYISIVDEGNFLDIPKLVIAGPLSSGFAKAIQALAVGRVDIIFTGMLQGDEKWGALYLSEAFILPSHQENFGIAVVEALACSIPVLISDKINIWKEIEKGGGGIIKSDTEHGVRELLEQWIQFSKKEKHTYKSLAFNTYKESFTIEQAALQFTKQLNYSEIKS